MERESFEDSKVADALNKSFVSVKVDREERPDIDHVYMNFCQAMTGHGGWPLTVIMTPEKKPFFTGTYFPRTSSRGMPGLLEILAQVSRMWHKEREILLRSGDQLTQAMLEEAERTPLEKVSAKAIERGYESLSRSFDSVYGGFGPAPKFPAPHQITFLLRYGAANNNKTAVYMAEKTLEQMYKGGIFDHLGGGFSRYSTDRKWLVPHFEKMLYDNALLAIAYAEAYQATGRGLFRKVTGQVLDYVLRDMTSPEGAFYSAEDADSEGIEGKFYVWSYEELEGILGPKTARRFSSVYDVGWGGNFEGKSILNLIKTDLSVLEGEQAEFLQECRNRLFAARKVRIHPHKDDKILTAWNGLMIAALAIAGRVLAEPGYLEAGRRALDFILRHLTLPDGRLLARFREGEAAYPAYLDDYAFLIWGLIEMYQASFQPEYLQLALELAGITRDDFWDEKGQSFFLTGRGSEELLIRPKEFYDGAMPSGNSVMAGNLLRLAALTGQAGLEGQGQGLINAFAGVLNKYPAGYTALLQAFLFAQKPVRQVVIVDPDGGGAEEMLVVLRKAFLPFTVVHLLTPDNRQICELFPFLGGYEAKDGRATAYVCQNYACQTPLTDPRELARMLAMVQQ